MPTGPERAAEHPHRSGSTPLCFLHGLVTTAHAAFVVVGAGLLLIVIDAGVHGQAAAMGAIAVVLLG
ncbi:hypothetical protein DVS28_b0259 (plasmid) [Euzebya pacifica]|uniref:Uncharacterized protein n=1 Tax=Euzebya pacifica TaxID=1608957 RepID=A0A346Y6D2_9ACTN|nr:hypothetical protein DVS28_b0259 [Euzebya pacifica]